jgi:hypothetical protein
VGAAGAHADAGAAHVRLHELVPQHRPQAAAERAGHGVPAPRQRANVVYVDPEHDLVAVVRWIESSAVDGFVRRLLAAESGR